MVTVVADSEGTPDQRVKDAFFIVETNQKQLLEIAKMLDAGILKAFVSAVVPLEEASAAYSRAVRDKRGDGKVGIAVSANPRRAAVACAVGVGFPTISGSPPHANGLASAVRAKQVT